MTTDSDELEKLFDNVAQQHWGEQSKAEAVRSDPIDPASAPPPTSVKKNARKKTVKAPENRESDCVNVINEVGHLTRSLHDSLRALGYDKELESAAAAIPNARDRLSYVAQLTQQAADRVLNATDIAKPIQATLERDASGFDKRWDAMFEGKLDVEGFRCLAQETHAFLKDIPSRTKQTDAQLLEIVMAQDFQDLTGQVLKKVTTLVQDVEAKLLQLLLDHMPSATQEACADAGLEGPIVNANGRTDVVTNQAQVDDLLASLGF